MLRAPGEDMPERTGSPECPRAKKYVGMAFPLICAILNLLVICWPAEANPADQSSRVLVIYQDSSILKSAEGIGMGISRGLEKITAGRLDLYTEYLDAPRFSRDEDFRNSAEYLGSKYGKLHIDILVPIGPEALRFALNHRDLFAPKAKVVFGDISERTYARLKPPDDFAGAITAYDIKRSVDLAIGLQSEAADIVVMSGSAEFDIYWQSSAREALGEKYRNLPVAYVSGLLLPEFVAHASRLNSRSILLILTIFEDSLGQKYRPRDAVLEITKGSGAPSYGLLSSYAGTGIVGGHIATYESIGTDVAELIARAASGDKPKVVHAASHPVVDWRQMQRWAMDRADLPAETQLLNFKPTLWEDYRWQILTVALLVLTEALAIIALYMERRSRLSAEVQARSRLLALVHLNQSATAGALSASIAHELNQPLGAIRSNAEAAEAILMGTAPDLNLVQQILADIRDDDERAGEIIVRLRGMLKKRNAIDWQEFDLNEVVSSSISILHAEAENKQVAVRAKQSKIKLPVRADKVHLQQVILNLATNAMDAMAESATVDRKLTFRTTLHGDRKVEMSISDNGQGIPRERLDRIFEAFYTTKPNGTGLGLSIARAIVETYGGKIWADNRDDGGAVFRFVLPLAQAA
jgi:signal transduction histidine kinase